MVAINLWGFLELKWFLHSHFPSLLRSWLHYLNWIGWSFHFLSWVAGFLYFDWSEDLRPEMELLDSFFSLDWIFSLMKMSFANCFLWFEISQLNRYSISIEHSAHFARVGWKCSRSLKLGFIQLEADCVFSFCPWNVFQTGLLFFEWVCWIMFYFTLHLFYCCDFRAFLNSTRF